MDICIKVNIIFIIKKIKKNTLLSLIYYYYFRTVLSNENSDLSHNLLHSLIVLINWQDEMYSDVLRIYFNKTVKIDDPSLKTLVILFKTRGFCSVSLNKTVSIKYYHHSSITSMYFYLSNNGIFL